jgi:chromosomal replication initiation ATPase DnaA
MKDLIIETVEEISGFKFEEFTGTNSKTGKICRVEEYVYLRRIVIVLMRNYWKFEGVQISLKQIGKQIPSAGTLKGHLDHSTIIHALRQHEADLKYMKGYKEMYERYANLLELKMSFETGGVLNSFANVAQL